MTHNMTLTVNSVLQSLPRNYFKGPNSDAIFECLHTIFCHKNLENETYI